MESERESGRLGRREAAADAYTQVLSILKANADPDSEETARVLNNASIILIAGDKDTAFDCMEAAWEMYGRLGLSDAHKGLEQRLRKLKRIVERAAKRRG